MSDLQLQIQQIGNDINSYYSKLINLYMSLATNEKIAWITMITGAILILIGLIMLIL